MSVRSAKELVVHRKAYVLAMGVFEVGKRFPAEERFALNISNQAFIPIGLFEPSRGLGEASLRCPFREQAQGIVMESIARQIVPSIAREAATTSPTPGTANRSNAGFNDPALGCLFS